MDRMLKFLPSPLFDTAEPGGTVAEPVVTTPDPGTAPLAPPKGYIPVAVFQNRVDELTAARHESVRQASDLQSQLVAAQARLQALQLATVQPPGVAPANAPTPALNRQITDEVIERQVEERVNARASEMEFNNRSNAAAAEGKKLYGDSFTESLSTLQALGVISTNFIEMALETGSAAKVIHELGKDPEMAQKIRLMRPAQQAIAVAKLAGGLQSPVVVSGAPAPIDPITGAAGNRRTPATERQDSSIEDWMTERNEQIAARNKRK